MLDGISRAVARRVHQRSDAAGSDGNGPRRSLAHERRVSRRSSELCTPAPDSGADAEIERPNLALVGFEMLHVGSTIPRKRIDVLLEVFAGIRSSAA